VRRPGLGQDAPATHRYPLRHLGRNCGRLYFLGFRPGTPIVSLGICPSSTVELSV